MGEAAKPQVTVNSHGEDIDLLEVLSICKQVLPGSAAEELKKRVFRSATHKKAIGVVREYVNLIDKSEIAVYEREKGKKH